MSASGHLAAEFARACERGNYPLALALAEQLRPLSAVEALCLLPLIAEHDPSRFDAAAMRWLVRWATERPRVDLAHALVALGALEVLRGPRRAEGLALLRSLL